MLLDLDDAEDDFVFCKYQKYQTIFWVWSGGPDVDRIFERWFYPRRGLWVERSWTVGSPKHVSRDQKDSRDLNNPNLNKPKTRKIEHHEVRMIWVQRN